VRELLDTFNRVSDRPVKAWEAGRRPGHAADVYTRIDHAARLLAWQPQYDIADRIRHSLQWAAVRDDILITYCKRFVGSRCLALHRIGVVLNRLENPPVVRVKGITVSLSRRRGAEEDMAGRCTERGVEQ
jgi:hypothetical protein